LTVILASGRAPLSSLLTVTTTLPVSLAAASARNPIARFAD
jgi:hypothetical protein